jgi:hypothetical protein
MIETSLDARLMKLDFRGNLVNPISKKQKITFNAN